MLIRHTLLLQGLHATVNILSAELVDINKEEHCVVLLDKRKLQYGLLLLAVGLDKNDALLQQQLKGSLNSISSQDLPASIPEVCAILSDFCMELLTSGPNLWVLLGTGVLSAYWVTVGTIISVIVFASRPSMVCLPQWS